jgi:hypothetical protein
VEEIPKLPPPKVPILFPVAASVKEPAFIVVKYATPPLRLTVPALKVDSSRFAPFVKLVTPAPLSAPIATEPPLAVNTKFPALLTFPSDPAAVAVVPKVPENVAEPLVMVRLFPPAKSVPTVKLPLLSVNAPL